MRRCYMKILSVGERRVVRDWVNIGTRNESKIKMIEHNFDIL